MLLAQFNIATIKYPLDDPRMKEFVDNIDLVHRIAERIGGLVKRLSDDSGTALNMRVYNDPRIVPNLTIWKDVASLETFVWKTLHKKFFDKREQWFDVSAKPKNVMWFCQPDYNPQMSDGVERLDYMIANGPSDYAFDWKYIKNAINS